MTAATPRRPDSESPEGVTVRGVSPGDPAWGRALGVLLTGRDAARDPRVAAFEDYAQRAGLDASGMVAAFDARGGTAGRPVAAAVAMESPGRTAMVLVSPLRGGGVGDGRVAAAAACVARTLGRLAEDSVTMAQCLLDLDQAGEAAALSAAGFSRLATLVYLRADLPGGRGPASRGGLPTVTVRDGGDVVALKPWDETPATRELFGRAILASYRDTQDCPGLVGTRGIDDILAGHRGSPGTHAFDPPLWNVALIDEQPVGALLLARLPEQDAVELVYLGVADTARGRGLGKSLLRRGLAQAARTGATQMLLAVDENNAPAIAMYRAAGFRSQQRRLAWVRFLQASP
ncbi:MAG: GNAT family N-acetyltransferase [Planctomycetota bacterium]